MATEQDSLDASPREMCAPVWTIENLTDLGRMQKSRWMQVYPQKYEHDHHDSIQ